MKSDKPEIVSVPLPLNLKNSELYRFLPYNKYERESIPIVNLKNVCVTRGGIVTKNLQLVEESVYAHKDRHSKYWKSAVFNFLFKVLSISEFEYSGINKTKSLVFSPKAINLGRASVIQW